jgi:hypothetical protein
LIFLTIVLQTQVQTDAPVAAAVYLSEYVVMADAAAVAVALSAPLLL